MAEDLEPDSDVPGPDASLQDWLKSPQSAEFLRQKALEHASTYADPDTPPSALPEIIRTNPNGTIAGNVTSPSNPDVSTTKPIYPTPDGKPIPSDNPLDPEEASTPVPLPRERPKEAGPGASDLSAQAKQKKSEALDSAMKSFSGIKAPTPPPLNAVGTPSVRSPGAVSAPNIANLLALTQSAQPNPLLQTLGKLLVAGKA